MFLFSATSQLLAAPERDDGSKLIIFLIIGAIWLISALAGAVKKRQEQMHREQLREQLAGALPQPPPVPATPTRRAPQKQAQKLKSKAPPKPIRKAQVVQPAALPPSPPQPAAHTAAHSEIADSEIRTETRAARPAMAHALNTWLRPDTLRQQFILTEILQPPLSLRSPPPHDWS